MLNLDVDLGKRNDEHLQEFIALTLGHVKSLHAALTGLMTDVAALRRTMLAEPEDKEQYQENLRVALETARPLVEEAMQSYDDMIQSVSDGKSWEN
jgi:hypothetical protein